MMEYAVAGLLLLIAGVLFWGFLRKGNEKEAWLVLQKETDSLRQELSSSITNHLSIVNQQLSSVTSNVTEQLKSVTHQIQASTGQINQRMDNAARVVNEVNKNLGALGEATKQVFEVGKDIAGLQEILKAPKFRGGVGEFLLGDLLSQILPSSHYQVQYTFKNGTRVDAVIKLNNGLVPIDSKFPLENFKKVVDGTTDEEKKSAKKSFIKDVKNRIDEIASSYIIPEEGTFNFALMYIPAENVYYETIIKDESLGDEKLIASYAFSKRVIPVSPNSFYAYLQTILLGLRGLEISKKAQTILMHLEGLQNEFGRLGDDFDVLGRHIQNARTKYEEAEKKVVRFGERLLSIAAEEKALETERPDEKGLRV
ncbi:MAG: DNA recombination protein RmuC [Deltaproteobacteria bacterium]|nr:DNA recombination protein RmuC [Deltaproteobacteria bacterium]